MADGDKTIAEPSPPAGPKGVEPQLKQKLVAAPPPWRNMRELGLRGPALAGVDEPVVHLSQPPEFDGLTLDVRQMESACKTTDVILLDASQGVVIGPSVNPVERYSVKAGLQVADKLVR
jgi:hypothetical protein